MRALGTNGAFLEDNVLDIGYPGFGKILFYLPETVYAEHQRVLVF
ncbi:hypothetical protein [Methanoregula sp.]|nr:hypothetical protein [Methanoregula sp.]